MPIESDSKEVILEYKNIDIDHINAYVDSVYDAGKDALYNYDYESTTECIALIMPYAKVGTYCNLKILKLKGLLAAFTDDHQSIILYFREGAEIAIHDSLWSVASNFTANLSSGFHLEEQYDSSLFYQNKAIDYAILSNDSDLIVKAYRETIPIYVELGNYDKATELSEEYVNWSDPDQTQLAFINLGKAAENSGKYLEAKSMYDSAYSIAIELKDSHNIALTLLNRASINHRLKHDSIAFELLLNSKELEDDLTLKEYSRGLRELELKYEDLEKDIALKDLTVQAEKDRAYIIYSSIGSLLLAITMIALFLYFRNRIISQRKLQAEEKKVLQKDMELASINASLQAIDEERKRVAMDLHDGIGVLASTARLRVSQVNKRINNEKLNEILYETDGALSEIAEDVKRIAHDMMPSTLHKLGLVAAIEDLIDNLHNLTSIRINSNLDIGTRPLDSKIEIMLFRIVQELLNNGIKHSQANTIELAMKHENNELSLTYSDDGKGVDFNTLNNKGNGFNTMKSRIEFLKGNVSFDATVKQGTIINFRLPLE